MVLSLATIFYQKNTRVSIVAVIVCLWMALVFYRSFPDTQGTDFYPLWLGYGSARKHYFTVATHMDRTPQSCSGILG